jgi:hypothetical protein
MTPPTPITPTPLRRSPSALGLVCGVVYMAFIIVTQLLYARTRHDLLANYNAALLSICFMVLLGASRPADAAPCRSGASVGVPLSSPL